MTNQKMKTNIEYRLKKCYIIIHNMEELFIMPIPHSPVPVEKIPARTKVYNVLCDWIIDGTLQPGEKISDTEIAGYFQISRTPVREAIQMLGEQRLLEIVPSKETRVAPIDIKESKQVYSLLATLHCEALKQALPKLRGRLLQTLNEVNERLRASIAERDPAVSLPLDREFHSVILGAAENHFLNDCIDKLSVHVLRVEYLHYKNPSIKISSAEEHDEIIKALENADEAAALTAMRENWLHFGLDLSDLK